MIYMQVKWGKFLIFFHLIRILSGNYSKKEEKKLLGSDSKMRKSSCFYGNEHGSFCVSPSFLVLFFSLRTHPAYFLVSNDFPTDESLNTELMKPSDTM